MSRSLLIAALPNLISLARLLAVPLAVSLILADRYGLAFWLFMAAGVSDAIDGFLAKHLHARSVLGGFLDPLADKALLMSVYVTLGYREQIEAWLVILVVFRDVVIIGGAILYHTVTQTLTMQPLLISKFNTAAQIVFAALLLGKLGLGVVEDYGAEWVMIHVVAATTLLSGAAYIAVWGWRFFRLEDKP